MLLSGTLGKGLKKGASRIWGMISLPHGLEPGGKDGSGGCKDQREAGGRVGTSSPGLSSESSKVSFE